MKKTVIFCFIILSLLFAQGLNDDYGGTWEGAWFNNTYQTTGAVYIEIYINETSMTYKTYTDIGGSVFGLGDPPPTQGQGSFTNTGVLSVVSQGPLLGDIVMNLDPGQRLVQWDGTNAAGRPVSGGVYLYSIQAGQYQETRKMLLIK
jgi:hypothetical protein